MLLDDSRLWAKPAPPNREMNAALAPEAAQTFVVSHAEGEAPAERVVGDAGELAQGGVEVLGADANPAGPVRITLRITLRRA